jgi:hypothetical protein
MVSAMFLHLSREILLAQSKGVILSLIGLLVVFIEAVSVVSADTKLIVSNERSNSFTVLTGDGA